MIISKINYSNINTKNYSNRNKQIVPTYNNLKSDCLSFKKRNEEKDTFEKKDAKKDKKKIAKYVAIGTGLAAIAYSAFTLIKYRDVGIHFGDKFTEPIKILKARRNPYDFKPKTDLKAF